MMPQNLSKILLLLALIYTKPFDLGHHFLGLARGSEFFGFIFRLADLALFIALWTIIPAFLKFKIKDFSQRKFIILSWLFLSLVAYWIYINIATLHSFKTGVLALFTLAISTILTYKYNPKWLLVLIPYFCFDHILISSTVAASIFILLGILAKDLNVNKVVVKWELTTLFLVLSVNLFLAIFQVKTGCSLGLGWLGEPNLSLSSTDGIAKQILPFSNQIVLRGYGLMPHPNILGFLGVFGFLFSTARFELTKLSKNIELLKLVNLGLSLAVIAVSMSRMAVIAIIIWGVLSLGLKSWNVDQFIGFKKLITRLPPYRKILFLVLPVFIFVLLFVSLTTRSNSDLYRLKQHQTFLNFVKDRPESLIFGVGPGQYPTQLREAKLTTNTWENESFYQPIGNLVIELGLVGMFLVIILSPKLLEIL